MLLMPSWMVGLATYSINFYIAPLEEHNNSEALCLFSSHYFTLFTIVTSCRNGCNSSRCRDFARVVPY